MDGSMSSMDPSRKRRRSSGVMRSLSLKIRRKQLLRRWSLCNCTRITCRGGKELARFARSRRVAHETPRKRLMLARADLHERVIDDGDSAVCDEQCSGVGDGGCLYTGVPFKVTAADMGLAISRIRQWSRVKGCCGSRGWIKACACLIFGDATR